MAVNFAPPDDALPGDAAAGRTLCLCAPARVGQVTLAIDFAANGLSSLAATLNGATIVEGCGVDMLLSYFRRAEALRQAEWQGVKELAGLPEVDTARDAAVHLRAAALLGNFDAAIGLLDWLGSSDDPMLTVVLLRYGVSGDAIKQAKDKPARVALLTDQLEACATAALSRAVDREDLLLSDKAFTLA
jgi:hypothetical protein